MLASTAAGGLGRTVWRRTSACTREQSAGRPVERRLRHPITVKCVIVAGPVHIAQSTAYVLLTMGERCAVSVPLAHRAHSAGRTCCRLDTWLSMYCINIDPPARSLARQASLGVPVIFPCTALPLAAV